MSGKSKQMRKIFVIPGSTSIRRKTYSLAELVNGTLISGAAVLGLR
jgi:hypothetical protein